MAGNNGASIAWQIYGRACMEVLGFGAERMKRLKQEAWNNYQQFNTWAHEDLDWAMENIRRCAEEALQSELIVIEDNGAGAKQAEEEFDQMCRDHARLRRSSLAASRNVTARNIMIQSDETVRQALETALQETLHAGLLRRRQI